VLVLLAAELPPRIARLTQGFDNLRPRVLGRLGGLDQLLRRFNRKLAM
jgi:hypothetical protein